MAYKFVIKAHVPEGIPVKTTFRFTFKWLSCEVVMRVICLVSCNESHIFKHGGHARHQQGLGSFWGDKKERNGAKHRQNPRGKHGLVCFPTDIGRQIHLSAEQLPKTQG
jgi:hypothetical protein